MDSPTDIRQIHRLLLRFVRNADTAAKIDELEGNPQFLVQVDDQVEHHIGRANETVGIQLIRNHHGMNSETFDTFIPHDAVRLKDLCSGQAVFRLLGKTDDRVAALHQRAGIVAE